MSETQQNRHHHHHHHYGHVRTGRIIVVAGCLFIIVVNALIFRVRDDHANPLPAVQLICVASLIWMLCGAWAMCNRQVWGRVLMLSILYIGATGSFIAIMYTLTAEDSIFKGRLRPVILAAGVYLFISLLFTHSRHVRRLTTRAYD